MDKLAYLVKEAEVRGVLAGLVDTGHLKVASVEDIDAMAGAVSDMIEGTDYDLDTVLDKTAELIEYLNSDEYAQEEQEKTAGEIDETARMAAFGELSMMKMAGEIDEDSFVSAIEELGFQVKEAGNAWSDMMLGRNGKGGANKAKASDFENVLRTPELSNSDFRSPKGSNIPKQKTVIHAPHRPGPAPTSKTSPAGSFDKKPSVADKVKKGFGGAKETASSLARKAGDYAFRHPGQMKALKGVGGAAALAGAAVGGKALYDKYKK